MKDAPPVELVSLHSVSKGFLGECGIRGGYFELAGFDPEVQAQLLKLVAPLRRRAPHAAGSGSAPLRRGGAR